MLKYGREKISFSDLSTGTDHFNDRFAFHTIETPFYRVENVHSKKAKEGRIHTRIINIVDAECRTGKYLKKKHHGVLVRNLTKGWLCGEKRYQRHSLSFL
jgi:hypothetical protein